MHNVSYRNRSRQPKIRMRKMEIKINVIVFSSFKTPRRAHPKYTGNNSPTISVT